MNNQLQKNNSFLGYTDNRTALQAGKIEKILTKKFNYDGVIMERRDAMLMDLRAGKTPDMVEENVNGKNKKSYRLNFTIVGGRFDGAKVFNEITKTEYEFCLYLIRNELVSEENVNAYIEKEKANRAAEAEEKRQEEETAKREEEYREGEKRAFKKWLNSAAEMYADTTKGNLMERIFLDKYGEFKYPVKAFEILACIDNIEEPMCREELKKRLHTGNVGGRKTFECITGLKLPKTNRETMEFLDKVQKSDYTGMVEYKPRKKKQSEEGSEKANAPEAVALKEFYILEFDPKSGNKKPQYSMVMGEPICKKGFDCFIHEASDGRFSISSAECGVRLAVGSTKSEAVKELKKLINKVGDVTLRNKIKEVVSVYGISPAYKNIA